MKTVCTTNCKGDKDIIISIEDSAQFNRVYDIVNSIVRHIDEITTPAQKYIMLNFTWEVKGEIFFRSANWVISEEEKIGHDYFTMNPDSIEREGSAEYIIDLFLKNAIYFHIGGKFFFLDK